MEKSPLNLAEEVKRKGQGREEREAQYKRGRALSSYRKKLNNYLFYYFELFLGSVFSKRLEGFWKMEDFPINGNVDSVDVTGSCGVVLFTFYNIKAVFFGFSLFRT